MNSKGTCARQATQQEQEGWNRLGPHRWKHHCQGQLMGRMLVFFDTPTTTGRQRVDTTSRHNPPLGHALPRTSEFPKILVRLAMHTSLLLHCWTTTEEAPGVRNPSISFENWKWAKEKKRGGRMRGRERREKEREGRTRLGGENEFTPWASKRMTNEIGRERERDDHHRGAKGRLDQRERTRP